MQLLESKTTQPTNESPYSETFKLNAPIAKEWILNCTIISYIWKCRAPTEGKKYIEFELWGLIWIDWLKSKNGG